MTTDNNKNKTDKDNKDMMSIIDEKDVIETKIDNNKILTKESINTKKENMYKVISGSFVDMKNVVYAFGDEIALTDNQIKKYESVGVIGTALAKI